MERLVLLRGFDAAALHRVARGLGCRAVPADAARWPHAVWHFVAPGGSSALWVDDHDAGWPYLLVPTASAATWRRQLADAGLLLDRGAALALGAAARDADDVRDAVAAMGLLAHGPFDAEVYAYIVAALASPDDGVRAEALSAVTMSAWPEFEAALRAAPRAAEAGAAWLREADEIADTMTAGRWNEDFYGADPPAP